MRIKRIITAFILCLMAFNAYNQIASKEIHDKVSAVLLKEYNAKNYKAIYKLLDKDYQKSISEKELADFFKFNLFDNYGEFSGFTFTEARKEYYLYKATGKNGSLELYLTCGLNEKISGMQWMPYKENLPEVIELKSGSIVSDNPKANVWDLKIDSIVNVYMKNPNNCGLSLAIYNNGLIQYYNYGQIKKGSNQLPSNTTIYEIGSVSKTFTGILLAKAITDKKVSANDPVKKHLGDDYENLAFRGKNIELIHLANHTSRLHRVPYDLLQQPNTDPLNPYAAYNKKMVLDYVSKFKPDTFPGVKNEYSNLGMGLLGMTFEKVYNLSYEQLTDSFICKPLSMSDTKITLNSEQAKRFATGYTSDGYETPYWGFVALEGAGGLRSTTKDMISFVKGNLEESQTYFKLSHQSTFNDGNNNIAMGWHLFTTKKSNEMIWHNGRTGGFSSFCGFIKSKNVGVVVLSNTGNPCDQIALGILKLLQ